MILGNRYCVIDTLEVEGHLLYLCTDRRLPGSRWLAQPMADRHQAWRQAANEHPSLPMVADMLEVEGRYFLITEFVEGRTLEGREHPPGIRESFYQFLECLKSLRQGQSFLTSRDNVVVTADGRVRLRTRLAYSGRAQVKAKAGFATSLRTLWSLLSRWAPPRSNRALGPGLRCFHLR